METDGLGVKVNIIFSSYLGMTTMCNQEDAHTIIYHSHMPLFSFLIYLTLYNPKGLNNVKN